MKALPKVFLPKPQGASIAESRLIDANQNTLNDNFLRLITELNGMETGGGVDPAVIAQLRSDITVLQGGVATLQTDLAAAIAEHVNQNLLDNWYFLGSGSQATGKQFPINQRGNTSYTGQKWTIDRWYASSTNSSVELTNGHLAIGASGGSIANNYGIAYQSIESPARLAGKKVTLSVLTASPAPSHPFSFTIHTIDSNNTGHWVGLDINDPQADTLYTKTVTVPDDVTWMDLHFYAGAEFASGDKIHLAAVKMELGESSTLATGTQVRGIPDFTDELLRCQRYQVAMNPWKVADRHIGWAIATGTTSAQAVITLPVVMRDRPTAVSPTTWRLRYPNTNYSVTAITCYNAGHTVHLSMTSSSLTQGRMYMVRNVSASDILLLDANL